MLLEWIFWITKIFLKCLVLTYSYLISTLIPEEKNAIQRGIDIVPTTISTAIQLFI